MAAALLKVPAGRPGTIPARRAPDLLRKEEPARAEPAPSAVQKAREGWKMGERRIDLKPFLAIGGGLVALLILFFIGKALLSNLPASPAPTQIPQTSEVSKTSEVFPASTTIPPTPKPDIGSTQISEKDGMVMVFVPEGEFTMGTMMAMTMKSLPIRYILTLTGLTRPK